MYLTIDDTVPFVVTLRNSKGKSILSSNRYTNKQNAVRGAKRIMTLSPTNLVVKQDDDGVINLNLVSDVGRVLASTSYANKQNANRARKTIACNMPVLECIDNTN